MATFDDVAYKVKTVAETAGKKTAALVDLGKLRWQKTVCEHELSAALEELGRLVFTARQTNEDVSAQVDDRVEQIAQKQRELTEIETKIDEGVNRVRCDRCGAMNADGACYCQKCGAELSKN